MFNEKIQPNVSVIGYRICFYFITDKNRSIERLINSMEAMDANFVKKIGVLLQWMRTLKKR